MLCSVDDSIDHRVAHACFVLMQFSTSGGRRSISGDATTSPFIVTIWDSASTGFRRSTINWQRRVRTDGCDRRASTLMILTIASGDRLDVKNATVVHRQGFESFNAATFVPYWPKLHFSDDGLFASLHSFCR